MNSPTSMRTSLTVFLVLGRSLIVSADEAEPVTLAPSGDKLASTATDVRKGEDSTKTRRYLLIAGETGALFGLGAGWYWATAENQQKDWAYDGSFGQWKDKLLRPSDSIRFDSNPLLINAFGHSNQAMLAYQIGRGNGLGFGGSALLNIAHSVVWEYVVEFREQVAINDLIVNATSGPALGEPIWQVGDYFRSGPKTTANQVLAAVFSPFDSIERKANHRGWQSSARPWHRFRLFGGGVTSDASTAANVGADLEVVSFDRSGAKSGWTPAGGWSRIATNVRFDGDGIRGASFASRTSYGGYQTRAVFEDGIGRSAFIGFGTGISYESSKLAMERDQFAAYHLLGPQVDVHVRTRNVGVRLQAAAYGDFGLVHAFALGGMPAIDPDPPFESPLTAHGYYFGVGGTAYTRLLVVWDRWHADLEGHAHQLFSLDKRDSDRGEPDAPRDLADGRLFGRATIGAALTPRWLVLDGVVDVIGRRGTIGDVDRRAAEQRFGLQLTLQY
jgi:hypothetical protein